MNARKLSIYEVDERYTDYLRSGDDKVANEKKGRTKRKYIGILLTINDVMYIAPFTSQKMKHKKIVDSVDMVKVGNISVINLNNMIPVNPTVIKRVVFNDVLDLSYREILKHEFRIINKHSKKTRIVKPSATVHEKY
ncbi:MULTISPECIES: type III toxin-antitoxin system ToxN/AbiQ family toxin [unclassified Granulicatella]|uniref:type III toxin-antitoxin system ToxN/AbiQ family toxin n=1 Tax=unclassified Granulicatella TaxID=2630493 RepID=UPI0010748B6D|nr:MULTISPECIES: type III toxin-antitoxin system ToxN/AbiQ family toxin [unclassified Granulicatella]MBF0780767.1 type III toxin-antitoxin system ToxN/AbiQ family toxin [Granulicatella sp. 19428wC4_WM01]TFU93888.1 type III toxin-antitoxin system ToxN/AbiQ family toxin [Granulicatella sp. WM01]